jgi:hypothetical protein
MFGLSFGKFVVLAILILVVWYGFKHVMRTERVRQGPAPKRTAGESGSRRIEAEDMTKCASCGAYVAARGASNCGRPDCPW